MGKQPAKASCPVVSESSESGGEGDVASVQIAQQLAVLAEEAARVAAGLQRSGGSRRRRRSRGGGRSGGGSSAEGVEASGSSGGSLKIYAVSNPDVAPQGVYLTRDRLEAAFLPGVTWGALGGSKGDLKGFPVGPGDVRNALAYYSARHPRAGKITVYE